ncbi:SH3 domain-containing protein [Kitasatospora sp. NPDC005856]|uniref:SH3 domain-containing protein n=1 Tax=Kitasatospora sp. NPDC005856 TaxID=3154566 RepID=UPI0033CC3B15
MRIRRALVATAVGATLALGAAAAPATAAAPSAAVEVTCGNVYWPHTDKDSGSGTVKSGGAAVHTGPYGACNTVGTIGEGIKVEYDCYSVNGYGNRWTWVRMVGGGSFGWVYGAYLSNGGATVRC